MSDLQRAVQPIFSRYVQCSCCARVMCTPSEWIMYELGVLPVFEENDLLKVDKILGLTFKKARKDFEALLKKLFLVFDLA